MKVPSLKRQFLSAIGVVGLVVLTFWAFDSVADVLPMSARHAILEHYESGNQFKRADIVWMMRGDLDGDESNVDRRWCVCVDSAPADSNVEERSLWLAERTGDDWRVRRVADRPDYESPAWTKYNCPAPGDATH